jgi:Flp pilus assembly protein TadG
MKGRAKDERGAVAVEFAIISTMLFMLIFGIIAFGNVYSQYEVFLGAAREGARYAAVRCGPDSGTGCTNAMVATKVSNSLTQGYSLSSTPAPDKTCSDTTVGTPVTVSWNQTFHLNIPFVANWTPSLLIKGVFRCE